MSEHPSHRFAILRAKARTGIWIEAGGVVLLALLAYAAVSFVLDRNLRLEWPFRLALLAIFAFVVLRLLRGRLLRPLATPLGDDEMALAVERAAPDMRQALISSVQFERVLAAGAPGAAALPGGDSRELMQALVADVHGRLAAIPFQGALDGRRVLRYAGCGLGVLLLFGTWAGLDGGSLKLWAMRNLGLSAVEWPRYTQLRFVVDTEGGIERLPQGDSLTLRVEAAGEPVDQVFLHYAFQGGESGQEPMSATGEREFTLTLESVLEAVDVYATGGDGLSETLRIEVVERPRIGDLALQVHFPEYMRKDPEAIEPTEGELRVPRGSRVQIAGRSHKPIREAFLLVGEQKTALVVDGDHAFRGEYVPTATGLMVIDVIDRDRLGAGAPPRLLLRIVEDKPPSLDFKMRGIGSLITHQARIPGDLKVKDDFGVRHVRASLRAVQEAGAEGPKPEQPQEVPFEDVEVIWGSQLAQNAIRYETPASIDLMQWSPEEDQASTNNRIRPGMLLSLRFAATDNFGPGEPHEAFGEVITFRVVTRDKLIEELRRRQVEQRQELQRILEEEKLALLELRETLNPTAEDERAKRAQGRLRVLARQQMAMGRRVGYVAEQYQRILWEFENNRLLEPQRVRDIEALIPQPLTAMAKDDFPATARVAEQFASTGVEATRSEAVDGYSRIVARIEAVLKHMEQMETLAALLEELRAVIKTQDGAMHDVERRLRATVEQFFHPGAGNPKDDKDGKK